jgi:hypothetical protein
VENEDMALIDETIYLVPERLSHKSFDNFL